MSRTPLLDSLKALVAAGTNKGHFYDLRSGSLADMWGTLNLTPNGGARLQRNGGATSVLGTDKFSTADTGLAGSTEVTCLIFFTRGASLPTGTSSRFYNDFDGASGQFINVQKAGDRIGFQTTSSGGVKSSLSTATELFLVGETKLLAMSCRNDNADGVRLYINGVASAHANVSTAGVTITFNATGLLLPSSTAAATGNGVFYTEMVINKYLTPAEHAQLYDEIVNQIVYDWNSGGIVIDPATGATLYDYKGGWGIIESTANEGGATGTPISNTEWVCGDATGRFKVVTQTGPNGQRGKGIKCITGGTLTKLSVSAADTWLYHWYDDSATAWKTQADAIHAGATFTLAANDILWIADEAGPRAYDIRHTPA